MVRTHAAARDIATLISLHINCDTCECECVRISACASLCARCGRQGGAYLETTWRCCQGDGNNFIYVLAKLLAEIFIKFISISNPGRAAQSCYEYIGKLCAESSAAIYPETCSHSARPCGVWVMHAGTHKCRRFQLCHTHSHTHSWCTHTTETNSGNKATPKDAPWYEPRPLLDAVTCPKVIPSACCVALNLLEFLLCHRVEASRGEWRRLRASTHNKILSICPSVCHSQLLSLSRGEKYFPCLSHLKTNNFVNVPLSVAWHRSAAGPTTVTAVARDKYKYNMSFTFLLLKSLSLALFFPHTLAGRQMLSNLQHITRMFYSYCSYKKTVTSPQANRIEVK